MFSDLFLVIPVSKIGVGDGRVRLVFGVCLRLGFGLSWHIYLFVDDLSIRVLNDGDYFDASWFFHGFLSLVVLFLTHDQN